MTTNPHCAHRSRRRCPGTPCFPQLVITFFPAPAVVDVRLAGCSGGRPGGPTGAAPGGRAAGTVQARALPCRGSGRVRPDDPGAFYAVGFEDDPSEDGIAAFGGPDGALRHASLL